MDYQVPVTFPLTVTGEFMFTKNINAVTVNNINIKDPSEWQYYTQNGAGEWVASAKGAQRFNGADDRIKYPTHTIVTGTNPDGTPKTQTINDYQYQQGTNAVMLDNTSKGYGYTANITVNAQPVDNLMLMLAYTHTESKEISGLPGSDPVSTWQGLNTIDGPNFGTVQRLSLIHI